MNYSKISSISNKPNLNKQKQITKYYSSGLSLMSILIKDIKNRNLIWSLQKLNAYSKSLIQKGKILTNALNKLNKKKILQHQNSFISHLIQFKISSIVKKRQQIQNLKQKSKNFSTNILFTIMIKNIKSKISNTFLQIKQKSALIHKKKTHKTYKIVNSILRINKKNLSNAIRCIKWHSFLLLSKYKRCHAINDLYSRKRLQNIDYALSILRNKQIKLQQNNKQVKQPSFSLNKNMKDSKVLQDVNLQTDVIKQLQQKKKQLQNDLKSKKNSNRVNIKSKEDQVNKIQEQYQSLKFSFDLVGQENEELKQNLVERQRIKQQADQRQNSLKNNANLQCNIDKKVHLLDESQIWNSVVDNLLLFLYRAKTGSSNEGTKQVKFKVQELLQIVTTPIINSSSIYPNRAQLKQQNTVLEQLLNSYKTIFQSQSNNNKLSSNKKLVNGQNQSIDPYFLNRQRKYYYQVIESLARWGSNDAPQLQQIKSSIEKLKLNSFSR